MKNWKQSVFFGMVAIIALGFAFVACGGDDGKDEKQTPAVGDFNISGIGEFDYDGTAKTVTIAPKPNKSTGAITVYYNGTVTAPITINTYSVTFDVAEAEGFNAKNGLVAGTLVIGGPNAYGIPVIGIDGFEVTDAHVASIKAAFDYTTENGGPEQAEYMKNNVKEFRIFSGDAHTWVGIDDGKLIVKISSAVIEFPGGRDNIVDRMYEYAMSKAVNVVDATGRLVGTCLNGQIITSNNYTLYIISSTGILSWSGPFYASEENGEGTLYDGTSWFRSYPNFVIRYGNEYYKIKNLDAEGYPTTIIPSVSVKSWYNSTWSNYSSPSTLTDVVELEKFAEATDDSYFIGFTPTLPLKFKF